jgi:dolichol-phosphate mannosyltransferase
MLDRPMVWLILPTYEEAGNVERVVAAALAALARAAPGAHRILIVDDDSPDGTGRIADALAERHPEVGVLHRAEREGLGPAYLAGFAEALAGGATLVVEMDADLSHDPEDIVRLVAAMQDADLVLGSRYVRGGRVCDWGPFRRIVSRGGSLYAQAVLGLRVQDLTGGFKCFRREVLEAIDLDRISTRGYAFQVEMTYRALRRGFEVVEVPIVFRERRVGTSKMDLSIVAEAVWRLPLLRFGRGQVERAPSASGRGRYTL